MRLKKILAKKTANSLNFRHLQRSKQFPQTAIKKNIDFYVKKEKISFEKKNWMQFWCVRHFHTISSGFLSRESIQFSQQQQKKEKKKKNIARARIYRRAFIIKSAGREKKNFCFLSSLYRLLSLEKRSNYFFARRI